MPCWDANEGILQGGAHSSDRVEISLENTMPVFAQTFLGCAAAGSTLKCILWYSLCFFPLHSIPSLQWVCMWVCLVPSCSTLEDTEYTIAFGHGVGCVPPLGPSWGRKERKIPQRLHVGHGDVTLSSMLLCMCARAARAGGSAVSVPAHSLLCRSGIIESQTGMGWGGYQR